MQIFRAYFRFFYIFCPKRRFSIRQIRRVAGVDVPMTTRQNTADNQTPLRLIEIAGAK